MSATPTQIQRYQTAGGVVIYQQQMLLLDRPARQEVRLPKGHIDPGETPAITALRETREESGYVDLTILAEAAMQGDERHIEQRPIDFRHVDDLRIELQHAVPAATQRPADRRATVQADLALIGIPSGQ